MTMLSVIIPSYNEANTILTIIEKVINVKLIGNISKEIIVVDDCSIDNTEQLIKEFSSKNLKDSIKYIKQDENLGKGAAIHQGITEATGQYVVIQDADLEYDPKDYNKLLNPIISGKADVVYGSRFIGDDPHRVLYFWHYIGNKFLTCFSNMCSNLNLTDMETCYKMFKAEIIKSVNLKEKRFGFEPEVTAKIARIKGIKIYEVGISYYGRTYEDGKKIGWKDGFRAVWCIIKYGLFKKND